MNSVIRTFLLLSTVLIGVLILVLSGGLQDIEAATESSDLTVDQILERVESKYANSKYVLSFHYVGLGVQQTHYSKFPDKFSL